MFLAAKSERLLSEGLGSYLVSLKPSNEDSSVPFSERELVPIGVVSMQVARLEGVAAPTIPDVGFNMLEKYHGKGYATEAVQGIMDYFRKEKGVDVLQNCVNALQDYVYVLYKD